MSPRQSLSRGPWYLKAFGFPPKSREWQMMWMPDKKSQAWRWGCHPWIVLLPLIRHPWMPLSGVHKYWKDVDSRLKISGMTKKGCHPWTPLSFPCLSFLNDSIRNLNNRTGNPLCIFSPKSVTSECFYQGSTVFKAFGFPIKDFGNDKVFGCLIKNLRHDGGGWIPDY